MIVFGGFTGHGSVLGEPPKKHHQSRRAMTLSCTGWHPQFIRPIRRILQFPTQLPEPVPEHDAERRAGIDPVSSANQPDPLPPSS